jgi:hypothetical protein
VALPIEERLWRTEAFGAPVLSSVRAQRAIADISNAIGGSPYSARTKN